MCYIIKPIYLSATKILICVYMQCGYIALLSSSSHFCLALLTPPSCLSLTSFPAHPISYCLLSLSFHFPFPSFSHSFPSPPPPFPSLLPLSPFPPSPSLSSLSPCSFFSLHSPSPSFPLTFLPFPLSPCSFFPPLSFSFLPPHFSSLPPLSPCPSPSSFLSFLSPLSLLP